MLKKIIILLFVSTSIFAQKKKKITKNSKNDTLIVVKETKNKVSIEKLFSDEDLMSGSTFRGIPK